MYRKNNDSKKITIAAISLCTVAIILVVFTVMVYKNKRLTNDDFGNIYPPADNHPQDIVTDTDMPAESQESISSNEESSVSSEILSSTEEVSSAEHTKNESNDILNPDNKSEFYMVVYTGNQMIVVYQKDQNGKYTHQFHFLKCSTGTPDVTPTKEGVYKIQKKERWGEIGKSNYSQYCCLISKNDNYYIGSVSYSKKSAWTLKNNVYDNIGKPTTNGSIQLCVRDAYWIYKNMPTGTQVNVVNRDGPSVAIKALPKTVKKNAGWDPTDKWSKGNPYLETTTTAQKTTAHPTTITAQSTTTTTESTTAATQAPDENAIG